MHNYHNALKPSMKLPYRVTNTSSKRYPRGLVYQAVEPRRKKPGMSTIVVAPLVQNFKQVPTTQFDHPGKFLRFRLPACRVELIMVYDQLLLSKPSLDFRVLLIFLVACKRRKKIMRIREAPWSQLESGLKLP
jgi:hypothetical protein